MGFLDWIKRTPTRAEPEPEDEPIGDRHFTANGNPIKPLSQSEWQSDDYGVREFRHHVGQSKEGFHGGLETSVGGGEPMFQWSHPKSNREEAENAAHGMRERREVADGSHRSLARPTKETKAPDGTRQRAQVRDRGIER